MSEQQPILLTRKAARSRKMRRGVGLLFIYVGLVAGVVVTLSPFLWLVLPDEMYLAQARNCQTLAAEMRRYTELSRPIPQPLLTQYGAAVTPIWTTWLNYARMTCASGFIGCLVFFYSMIMGLGIISGASGQHFKHLLTEEVRLSLAPTLLRPEEVIGPFLTGREGMRYLWLVPLQFVTVLVGWAARDLPFQFFPALSARERTNYGLEVFPLGLRLGAVAAIGVAVLMTVGFVTPRNRAWKARLACRIRGKPALFDTGFYRLLGGGAGANIALMALCIVTMIFVAANVLDLYLQVPLAPPGAARNWKIFRDVASLAIVGGLTWYVARLHMRFLAHMRAKVLKEYYQFE